MANARLPAIYGSLLPFRFHFRERLQDPQRGQKFNGQDWLLGSNHFVAGYLQRSRFCPRILSGLRFQSYSFT